MYIQLLPYKLFVGKKKIKTNKINDHPPFAWSKAIKIGFSNKTLQGDLSELPSL